ncbi:MAG: hypothetical protein ABIS17_15520 [Casimicrobiaceae bacterium]
MNATMKPLIIAIGLALGASSSAFAQSPTNTPGANTQNKVGGTSVPGSPSAMSPSTTMGTTATTAPGTMATGSAKNPAFDTESEVAGKKVPGSPGKAMTKEGKATDKMHADKMHADKMHADKMHADKMHADKKHTGAKHKTDAMAKKNKDGTFDTQNEVAGKAVPGSPQKPMAGATTKDDTMTKSMDATTATGSMGTTATGKAKNSAFDTQSQVVGKDVPGAPVSPKTPK